jgi:DNA replication protein DnaC
MGELITERIARNAKELKLLGLAETADELVDRAEQAKLGYREFLDLVLESELGVVEGRRYTSRLKLSGLPHHKTLEEFDAAFQPELDPKRLAELRSLRFIERHVSALILGPPGVGKTHIAVGLAMDALKTGYLIRYTTLDDLIRELRQADRLGNLRQKLSHYQRPHLLICDLGRHRDYADRPCARWCERPALDGFCDGLTDLVVGIVTVLRGRQAWCLVVCSGRV